MLDQERKKSSFQVSCKLSTESCSQHATFPLNTMMASHRQCIVDSDGWIGVNEVDKKAMYAACAWVVRKHNPNPPYLRPSWA